MNLKIDLLRLSSMKNWGEKRNEKINSRRGLWDTIKCANLHIMDISAGERKRAERIYKETMITLQI